MLAALSARILHADLLRARTLERKGSSDLRFMHCDNEFVHLVIGFNLGVNMVTSYDLKKIDSDYFAVG